MRDALAEIGWGRALCYCVGQLQITILKSELLLSPLRTGLLRLFGASIGAQSVMHACTFFNVYRRGFRGLQLGHHMFIGNECLLDLAGGISMGYPATLAERVTILTHTNVGFTDHPLQKKIPSSVTAVHNGEDHARQFEITRLPTEVPEQTQAIAPHYKGGSLMSIPSPASSALPLKRILILTSAHHPYANIILRRLFESDLLKGKEVLVLEQECLMPGKSTVESLRRYWRSAGTRYVLAQAVKQYLFRLVQAWHAWLGNTQSLYYPYLPHDLPGVQRERVHTTSSPAMVQRLCEWHPDLLLSILSKEILRSPLLEAPHLGCVNIHPALLPHYRGMSPTFWCLANAEPMTGVTVHFIDSGIDTGGIIDQIQFPTKPFATEHALYVHCVQQGATLLEQLLRSLDRGEDVKARNPATAEGSYYSLPTRTAVRRFYRSGFRFFRLRELLCE